MNTAQASTSQVWSWLGDVPDPEIPVISVVDLGIVRDVAFVGDECVVTITPTYSGCPAMSMIALQVEAALLEAGLPQPRVRVVLSPAWTTDWMTEAGRQRLREYGIAPPAPRAPRRALFGLDEEVACPRCGSAETEKLSEFGSTACKALWRCTACREPFDHFKCI